MSQESLIFLRILSRFVDLRLVNEGGQLRGDAPAWEATHALYVFWSAWTHSVATGNLNKNSLSIAITSTFTSKPLIRASWVPRNTDNACLCPPRPGHRQPSPKCARSAGAGTLTTDSCAAASAALTEFEPEQNASTGHHRSKDYRTSVH